MSATRPKSLTSKAMRRIIVTLGLICGVLLAAAPGANASDPGEQFTVTECQGDSDTIARLYAAGLDRDPEQGGFDFWLTEYSRGNWTVPAIANFFVNSSEFTGNYGSLTQDGFIRQLYRNILGREGEQGGVTYWNGRMSGGMTRAQVLMRFAESPENVQRSGTVEPALGYYNEGRAAGPWLCGADMSAALLTINDFGSGWATRPLSASPTDPGCAASLASPSPRIGLNFERDSRVGPFSTNLLHVAPTPYGASLYLQQLRDATVDCADYSHPSGGEVTQVEVSVAPVGDEYFAIRRTITEDGYTFVQHVVAARVDRAVSLVSYFELFDNSIDEVEHLAAISVARLEQHLG